MKLRNLMLIIYTVLLLTSVLTNIVIYITLIAALFLFVVYFNAGTSPERKTQIKTWLDKEI